MSRDPVLHIKLSSLQKCIEAVRLENAFLPAPAQAPLSAFDIIKKAHELKLQMRKEYVIVTSTAKTKKRLDKTIEAEAGVVEKFNMILTSLQQINQKVNTSKIYKDGKNYLLLKEIAKEAHDYAIAFDFTPVEEGYKKFCEIAFDIMGKKYALNKIKYHLPKIYDVTECLKLVETDINPAGTKEFYQVWKKVAASYSTGFFDIIDQADWLHIIYARDEADQIGALYEDWLIAQFEGLMFLNVVPNMNQLYGKNAQKRYIEFAGKKGFKKKSTSEFQYDDKQKAYWEMINKGKEKRGEKV